MKLLRELRPTGQALALTIGNFDGLHRGHQAILAATVDAARRLQLTPAAMSFHPLAREFFARQKRLPDPPRLMSVSEKLGVMAEAGIELACIPKFDARFAAQSPQAFIDHLREMQVRWLMVGADFRFGAGRQGDLGTLQEAGRQYGFTVETLADIVDPSLNGLRVSSTAVRNALQNGQLGEAAHLLGAPYRIIGRVIHGKKLGRTLGFPTANIALTRRNPALGGVFAVRCRLVTRGLEGVVRSSQTGNALLGAASLGVNPAVSSLSSSAVRPHLEVFLFDFSADLYGQRLQVEFIERIRDEQHFASLDALKRQIADDCDQAREILTTSRPPFADPS